MEQTQAAHRFAQVTFPSLTGWEDDDHLAALKALHDSAPALEKSHDPFAKQLADLIGRSDFSSITNAAAARNFFEQNFTPHRIVTDEKSGLLTGYYEPEIKASYDPEPGFKVPVLARPDDLINLMEEADRGAKAGQMTHARQLPGGEIEPYPTRREIEEGALADRGLELMYVADPVDLFFMQVQGSGLARMTDGTAVRLIYAGKNGHNYTSIGRYLIDSGQFPSEDMTLQALIAWLKADPERARPVMWKNDSYIFFRVLGPEDQTRTLGTNDIPLTPLRSLAVDTAYYPLGLPIFISVPELKHAVENGETGFHRLMVAHDVGSAIRGPERGDLYYGSGIAAGEKAGPTKHACNFFALLPNPPSRS
ncbi:MAG: murein transglycosylase A [Filomicrobium sp.]